MSPFITLTRMRGPSVRVNAIAISYMQAAGNGTTNVFFGSHAVHVEQSPERVEVLIVAAIKGEEAPLEPAAEIDEDDISAEKAEARAALENGGTAAQAARAATGGRSAAARAKEAAAAAKAEAAAKA